MKGTISYEEIYKRAKELGLSFDQVFYLLVSDYPKANFMEFINTMKREERLNTEQLLELISLKK